MFNKLLGAIDGSDHALKALDQAADIAQKYDAQLIILHVPHRAENAEALRRFAEVEGLSKHVNVELDRLRTMDFRVGVKTESAFDEAAVSSRLLIEVGQHIFDEVRERARRKGLEKVDLRLEGGDPAGRILETIRDEGIDCAVVGSRGLGDLQGLFLGSVSHKVTIHAPRTCITVK
jgi:nucleotide-binding universal stress UspA family protein